MKSFSSRASRAPLRRLLLGAVAICFASGPGWFAGPAQAQGYFIPGQPPAGRAAPHPAARPQAVQTPPIGIPDQQAEPPIQVPMPPVPDLPPLPKGPSPPAAVIGVIAVPDVMRVSLAAQQVDRIIGERRAKLNADAQAEQNVWRSMQQALANDRAKLSPEQMRAREKALQDRITNATKTLRSRDRIIQEATQVAINAINANLLAVIRQVAESRNINLVMPRQGTILNTPEFDLTEQVVAVFNKLMPTIEIAPDGVSPLTALAPPTTAPVVAAPAAAAHITAPPPAKK